MNTIIVFLIGLSVGTFMGIAIMALMVMAGRDEAEAKLNELMVGQSKYREQIKMAIMVEMAKLGFHPTDYIAKHAKKDEQEK